MRRVIFTIFTIIGLVLCLTPLTSAVPYGTGEYGSCQYSSCSISLSSTTTVAVDITPTGTSTRCTTASDTVTVTTGSSTGYTLQLNDADSTNTMTRPGGGSIAATTGTPMSPVTLSTNQWGYRVDGVSGFGTGTTAQSNVASLAKNYARIPTSTSFDTIATTSIAANADPTTVWYGVCVDTSIPAGTYSDGIVYTATIN